MGVRKRQKQRKAFRHKVSAKRKQQVHKKKLNPTIELPEMQKGWDKTKSAPSNLEEMGLVYNLNKMKPSKGELLSLDNVAIEEPDETPTPRKKKQKKKVPVKETKIADQLEKAVKKRTRKKIVGGTRLPKDLVVYASTMLDKYGHDFKAMARDPTNYYQDSWKQIRAKVMRFIMNPRYFAPYLKERNRLNLPALPSEEEMSKA